MVNVHDVASYILAKSGTMSTMKLQKLCYYSQGWALAWDEQPLFDSRIEAWANGPVITELYNEHRGHFQVRDWPRGDETKIQGPAKETIDAVLGAYGALTGQQLSDMTHSERPWLQARGNLPNGSRCQAAVSLDVMQDFFGGLAAAAADDSRP